MNTLPISSDIELKNSFKIALDVDGVILDFIRSWEDCMGESGVDFDKKGHIYNLQERYQLSESHLDFVWNNFNKNAKWWSSIPERAGAIEAVNNLLISQHKVSIVTAIEEDVLPLRMKNFELLGIKVNREDITLTPHSMKKGKMEAYIRLKPDVVIDDHWDCLLDAKNAGILIRIHVVNSPDEPDCPYATHRSNCLSSAAEIVSRLANDPGEYLNENLDNNKSRRSGALKM